MSDVRVSATITPDTNQLVASFSLTTLQHHFEWLISNTSVSLTMSTLEGVIVSKVEHDIAAIKAGVPTRMQCWHVDQMMALYIGGERVAELFYEFNPEERLRYATDSEASVSVEEIAGEGGSEPVLQWQFDGSPFSMTRLQVDHDLYYRSGVLPSRATKNPTTQGNEALVALGSPAFGTHPDKLGVLGEDQFMLAGDNSMYSLDSRLWGNPDEFVAAQIDDSPFVVHRDLLIGKAWGVYWLPPPLVPEFNRFRFIR
jgi:hypothetical protein